MESRVEIAKAKRHCHTCKKPIVKGEAHLVEGGTHSRYRSNLCESCLSSFGYVIAKLNREEKWCKEIFSAKQ